MRLRATRLGVASGGAEIPLPRRVRNILSKYSASLLIPGASGVAVQTFSPGNYVESTGQTLTPVDGAVGLVVDAGSVPGVELVSNPGPFQTTLGWGSARGAVLGASNGRLTITGDGVTTFPAGYFGFNAISGRSYQVTVTAGAATTNTSVVVKTTKTYVGDVVSGATGTISASGGTLSFVFVATANAHSLGFENASPSWSGAIVSASVRELPGISATQATSQNKPALRRGLVNQLLWSSDFSNAAWTKTNVSVAGQRITPTAISATHSVNQSKAASTGVETLAVIAKADGYSWICLHINGSGTGFGYFDLSTGTLGSMTNAVGEIVPLDDGRVLCLLRASNVGSGQSVVYVANGNGGLSYLGNGTSGIFLHSAALFQGTVTAEQILAAGGIPVTTTAPASSAIGPQYWQFDGTDDRLQLSALPFGMSDDHFVVVGATASVVAQRDCFGLGNDANVTPMLSVIRFEANGNMQVLFRNDANTFTSLALTGAYSANEPVVVGMKKSGASGMFRKNGGAISTSSLALTTGATTLNTAAIGGVLRGASSLFHNGAVHGVIFGKGAISDSELLTLERWMATLQGRRI